MIPVILRIALGLSTGGSPIGAVFYIVVWNLLAYLGMRFAYFKGYELGDKAVEFLVGAQGQAIRKAVSIVWWYGCRWCCCHLGICPNIIPTW